MCANATLNDRSSSGSVSETVVKTIAASRGVDPQNLQPRLYDVIDPDGLDALFAGDRPADGLTVSFEYDGVPVEIAGSGEVTLGGD